MRLIKNEFSRQKSMIRFLRLFLSYLKILVENLLFKGLFQDGSKDLFPLFLKVAAFLFISFFCDDALLLNSIDLDVCEKIVSLEMSF